MLKSSHRWQQAHHTLPARLSPCLGSAPGAFLALPLLHHHQHFTAAAHPLCGTQVDQHRSVRARAREDRQGDGASSFMRREEDPGRLEMAVPSDQRPVNELQGLKQAQLYSWATLPLQDYVKRLAAVFVFFYAFVGGPISYQTFDPFTQPVAWALAAAVGSLVVVAVVVVRIFLGWQYVGDRLMSAAVDYEETGWYDGEVFVKPPEVLTRDRLLGMYEVKPVMAKLRSTLIGSGGMLLACALTLSGVISASSDEDGVYGRGAAMGRQTPDGVIFSKNVKDLSELKDDDEKAAEEALAAGGVPGYCRDRVLRAASTSNTEFCKKFGL